MTDLSVVDNAETAGTLTVTLPPAIDAEVRYNGNSREEPGWVWPEGRCAVSGADVWAIYQGKPYDGPGCGQRIEPGQRVRKVRGWWMHADCAAAMIGRSDVEEAWLLLADQVAARPHMFRARDIRTVLTQVADIASRYKAAAEPRAGGES